ncbi:TPA: glycosyltransferase family 2 protein, partial [Escherichia coli]|nr:glycosyltransferase family 2 protein [Escherichia coli]
MFSIVITTKDRAYYLKRAVDSILKSTISPKDIVIINDGGKAICENDFPPMKDITLSIVNNRFSMGANYSRNQGIDRTLTNYVFLLDDDDAFTPTTFENRINIIKSSVDIGVVFTGINIVSSKNLDKVIRKTKNINDQITTHQLLTEGNVIGSTSRALIRKDLFCEAGRFDPQLSCLQDYDLWIRMSLVSRIINDHKYGVYYTIHDNGRQISTNYEKYMQVGKLLINKYDSLLNKNTINAFKSNIYLRVAISASASSNKARLKYSFMSLKYRLNIKALAFFLFPSSVLKRLFN